MKFEISSNQIRINKELNDLDNLVIDFTKILRDSKVNYALVSGYVAILFGRSRSSEDIDVIVESVPSVEFLGLWNDLSKNFKCLTSYNPKTAYEKYLVKRNAVRFARGGFFVPNMEVKFPRTGLDNWVIENSKEVVLNGNATIKISPIELQIPYKLFLGSEKDIEDAKFLYQLFGKMLDKKMFRYFLENLDKEGRFNKYIE